MKKAVIYTRFSPRRNAEESESCEVQQAYCEQEAAKLKLTVGAVFHDPDVSGKDEYREKLWGAIEALGKGDTLVVFKRDRLARNVYLSEQINRAVEKRGAKIAAVAGDVSGEGPEHVMIRQVLSAIAEYERKMIAQRTSYAMKQHQRNGRRMGRYAPYGWRLGVGKGDPMEPVQPEMKAVARILELHGKGWGLVAITRALQEEYPTVARSGKWAPKSVRAIIKRNAK